MMKKTHATFVEEMIIINICWNVNVAKKLFATHIVMKGFQGTRSHKAVGIVECVKKLLKWKG